MVSLSLPQTRVIHPLAVISLLALIPIGYGIWRVTQAQYWWVAATLIPFMLIGYHYRKSVTFGWRLVYACFLIICIACFSAVLVSTARKTIAAPPKFDFGAFWVEARTAVKGLNFYDPQDLTPFAAPFQPDTEFITELPFSYPPQSMLWLAPLGLFEIPTAVILWMALHGLILIADIVLLWRIVLDRHDVLGLLLAAAFVVMLHPTLGTLFYAQTTFAGLLTTLLVAQYSIRTVGGLWIILGFLIKPVFGVLLLLPLLRRQWRQLAAAVAIFLALSLATVLVFGSTRTFSFLTSNRATNGNTPAYLYTETVNQSLLATILRVTRYDFSGGSPLRDPVYLVVALLIVGITGWLVARRNVVSDMHAVALLIAMALLVYPATLGDYGFVLILAIAWVWMQRSGKATNLLLTILFISVAYGLSSYDAPNNSFLMHLLVWLVVAGMGVRLVMSEPQKRTQMV